MASALKSRSRGPWLALASVAIVGALVTLVYPRVQRERGKQRLAEALARLDACVAGSGPRDDATLRRRAIAASLTTDADWPARCNALAADVGAAVTTVTSLGARCEGACCSDDGECERLDGMQALLRACRDALAHARFEEESYARLVEQATALGLPEASAAPDAPPPEAQSWPSADGRVPLSPRVHDVSALAVGPGGRWQLLLHTRGRQLTVCDVDPGPPTARCAPVPASVPLRDTVLLVDGALHAAPHLLVQHAAGHWQVFDAASGEARLELRHDPVGTSVLADGTAIALVRAGDAFAVVDSRDRHRDIDTVDALGPPLMLGDALVWPVARDGAVALRYRRLDADWAADAETALSIAGMSPGAIAMQACLGPTTLGVLLTATPGDADGQNALAFRTADGWKLVMPPPGAYGGFTCQGDAIALTAIDEVGSGPSEHAPNAVAGQYRLRQLRCDAVACHDQHATVLLERYSRGSRFLTAAIGSDIALFWRSRFGDVRLRVGALPEIERAAAQALFDDPQGQTWDSPQLELLARDGRALLLVPAPHGGEIATFGWLIDARGAQPLVP